MSSTMCQYLPYIINALSIAVDHQDNITSIVKRAEEHFKAYRHPTNNVMHDVHRCLEMGVDLGLLQTAENNFYRLRFNPNAKPPFKFPLNVSTNADFPVTEKSLIDESSSVQSNQTDYGIHDCNSQQTLYNDPSDANEDEMEFGRKLSPRSFRNAVPRSECPFSMCMKKFRMNKARRRREAAKRGTRSRSRSNVKRQKSKRRKR